MLITDPRDTIKLMQFYIIPKNWNKLIWRTQSLKCVVVFGQQNFLPFIKRTHSNFFFLVDQKTFFHGRKHSFGPKLIGSRHGKHVPTNNYHFFQFFSQIYPKENPNFILNGTRAHVPSSEHQKIHTPHSSRAHTCEENSSIYVCVRGKQTHTHTHTVKSIKFTLRWCSVYDRIKTPLYTRATRFTILSGSVYKIIITRRCLIYRKNWIEKRIKDL